MFRTYFVLGMSTINRRSVNRRVTICSVKNYILDQPKVFSCSSLGARQGEVYSLIIRCIGAAQCLHMRRRRHPALPKTLKRGTRLCLCWIILKERMVRHAAHFVAQLLNNQAERVGVDAASVCLLIGPDVQRRYCTAGVASMLSNRRHQRQASCTF